MTLLHMDGCGMGDGALRYGTYTGWQLTGARDVGSWCHRTSGTTASLRKAIDASAEVFAAQGLYCNSTSAGQWSLSLFGDSGTVQHLTVTINAANLLELRLGSKTGTVLATGTTVLTASLWRHVQLRGVIHSTAGVAQVRLNGAQEITYSGNTRNGGTSTNIDTVGIDASTSGIVFNSDIVVVNTVDSGDGFTSWPGDRIIYTQLVNANGSSSGLVGSDGNSVDNYQQVDERPYSATDYNGSSTPGARDLYGVTDTPAGVPGAAAIQVVAVTLKSDAGAISGKVAVKSGSTVDVGPALTPGTTATAHTRILTKNPDGGVAWTKAALDALEAGIEVAA